MNRVIRVPLAVDAQIRIPLGPTQLPLRAIFLMALFSPLAVLCLALVFLPSMYRVGGMIFVLLLAMAIASPMEEGIWFGTYTIYKYAYKVLPTAIIQGVSKRARVKAIGSAVQVSGVRSAYSSTKKYLSLLNNFSTVPSIIIESPGIIRLKPGGARAVMSVNGPTVSMSSDAYVMWCEQLINWLNSLECPAQFITVMNHYDRDRAQRAFAHRTAKWPRTPLREMEQQLAGDVAAQSLGFNHFVVLSPGIAGTDGVPYLNRVTKFASATEAKNNDAERLLQSAIRLTSSFGIEAHPANQDDMAPLLSNTILGAQQGAAGDGMLHLGNQHQVVVTVTKLPPSIEAGIVVEALMRARTSGVASLHLFPVDTVAARKVLSRQASMHKYAMRQGADSLESEVALADTQSVLAAIAKRTIRPCRVALTIAVSHHEKQAANDAAERLEGILNGHGFDVTRVTSPGFLPALALSPGSVPLARSLQMTTDDVVLRMLPALGTPFSNYNHPLVGVSVLTGAPTYFSVRTRPNHNMVIVGSSGAGKSVTTKTLLVRHVMEGVTAVVIDPDLEYGPVMEAIGGRYYELGNDALNPFAAGVGVPPDTAAGLILPILSVMGGDEKGVKDGRPIRRLPDEDQGWLHAEIATFYREWGEKHPGEEPVMHNLIDFLETESRSRALTEKEAERGHIITSRLRRFTQGKRALVFDRPSTFSVGKQPVGIGLRLFAMSYGADLTPALAVVLTSILSAVEKKEGRMVVVVDEAHRVTSDPDAGEVLGQLVRQARKYGAGVWMCSQRVEDFVGTDLGKTLASTAATKLILGVEEASVKDVQEVFSLNDEEVRFINPVVPGRGVLVSSGERTVVRVVPGAALKVLSDTSSMLNSLTSSLPEDDNTP